MNDLSNILNKIINELDSKKAINPVVLDTKGISSFSDYFIVASMDSERGVKALSEHINLLLKKELKIETKTDGLSSPSWVIIDTGDIMIHLFHKDAREYYQLNLYGAMLRSNNYFLGFLKNAGISKCSSSPRG